MQAAVTVLSSPEAVGQTLAKRLTAEVVAAWQRGQRYVLGCPGGRSLLPIYRTLPAELAAAGVEPGAVLIVMMDDYVVGSPDSPQRIDRTSHASCEGFAHREVTDPLRAFGADVEVWLPDPRTPQDYDSRIVQEGGVDLFLLASGATDGHVAFNPPGTDLAERTRVLQLAQTTRADNLQTFPDFDSIEAVPHHGVTVGPATIAESSARLAMVVTGAHKRTAFNRLTAVDSYDPQWPATVVHAGPPATIYADESAAGHTGPPANH